MSQRRRFGRVQPYLRWFLANQLEEAASGVFTTSEGKAVLPSRYLSSVVYPTKFRAGFIKRIHFRIKPTNAVTYTLRIWGTAINGAVTPYGENLKLLWESPAARASDVDYDETELDIPFGLGYVGRIYYSLEWSAAAGNCQGFIEVSGELVE
jgi:hypothetical protein